MNNEDIEILEHLCIGSDFHWGLYDLDANKVGSNRISEAIENLINRNKELEYKLEIEKIDNKYNQEERDEETIPRYIIRDLMQDIEETLQICKNDETKFFMSGFKNSIQELLKE